MCVLLCWKLNHSYLECDQGIIIYRSSLQPAVVSIFIFRVKNLRLIASEPGLELELLPPFQVLLSRTAALNQQHGTSSAEVFLWDFI